MDWADTNSRTSSSWRGSQDYRNWRKMALEYWVPILNTAFLANQSMRSFIRNTSWAKSLNSQHVKLFNMVWGFQPWSDPGYSASNRQAKRFDVLKNDKLEVTLSDDDVQLFCVPIKIRLKNRRPYEIKIADYHVLNKRWGPRLLINKT